jgi:hypothetical protein
VTRRIRTLILARLLLGVAHGVILRLKILTGRIQRVGVIRRSRSYTPSGTYTHCYDAQETLGTLQSHSRSGTTAPLPASSTLSGRSTDEEPPSDACHTAPFGCGLRYRAHTFRDVLCVFAHYPIPSDSGHTTVEV